MATPAMALLNWLFFCLAIIAEGKADTPENLEWPEVYTLKATKYSLTGDLIEDYQIWRTKNNSRIDYNHGAVKSIVRYYDGGDPISVKFDVRPKAFLNQTTRPVWFCYVSPAMLYLPETILPLTNGTNKTGLEIMNDKNTTKFIRDFRDDETREIKHIWATYNHTEKVWIPVRYEFLKYNTKLGYKKLHEIWDFYGFSMNFTDSVFYKNSKCTIGNEKINVNSEHVMKDLVTIDPENEDHLNHVYNIFKKNHCRNYTDEQEHRMRRIIFKENMRLVASTNSMKLGYKLAINKFSDRTPKEMTMYTGSRRHPEGNMGTIRFPYTEHELTKLSSNLPKEFDLRLQGLVSKVKNGDLCGASWSFAATAVAEGALALSNGNNFVNLANQALIDCAWGYGTDGCHGAAGTDHAAYKWMKEYGLPTVAEYGPYANKEGICNIKNMTKTYRIRGYTEVTPLSEQAMKIALINHGPVWVAVHATYSFRQYSSGIFYDIKCNQTLLNHEAAVVGYGERYGETFWILKNSWGPEWGIDGFMYISARDNVCGVTTKPTYVVF